MKKGIVFDIQRSSFVDGNGVRTTIFLKGCNLKCKWCHNPEGIDKSIQMLYHKDRCTDCGKCVQICPNDTKSCTLCGKCTVFCPNDAKEICGKEYTEAQLLEIALKDKSYYEASDGGVTLSGGECLLQINFVEALLKLLKENGIKTAIDTAGNVPYEFFQKIIPYTDTFLYDIKCIDESLHIEGTGYSNKLILDNLKRLSKDFGGKIVIRVPIIGSFNDTNEEILKIRGFLSNINYSKIELLPYHNMAQGKALALGMEFLEFLVPSKEKMEEFKSLLI